MNKQETADISAISAMTSMIQKNEKEEYVSAIDESFSYSPFTLYKFEQNVPFNIRKRPKSQTKTEYEYVYKRDVRSNSSPYSPKSIRERSVAHSLQLYERSVKSKKAINDSVDSVPSRKSIIDSRSSINLTHNTNSNQGTNHHDNSASNFVNNETNSPKNSITKEPDIQNSDPINKRGGILKNKINVKPYNFDKSISKGRDGTNKNKVKAIFSNRRKVIGSGKSTFVDVTDYDPSNVTDSVSYNSTINKAGGSVILSENSQRQVKINLQKDKEHIDQTIKSQDSNLKPPSRSSEGTTEIKMLSDNTESYDSSIYGNTPPIKVSFVDYSMGTKKNTHGDNYSDYSSVHSIKVKRKKRRGNLSDCGYEHVSVDYYDGENQKYYHKNSLGTDPVESKPNEQPKDITHSVHEGSNSEVTGESKAKENKDDTCVQSDTSHVKMEPLLDNSPHRNPQRQHEFTNDGYENNKPGILKKRKVHKRRRNIPNQYDNNDDHNNGNTNDDKNSTETEQDRYNRIDDKNKNDEFLDKHDDPDFTSTANIYRDQSRSRRRSKKLSRSTGLKNKRSKVENHNDADEHRENNYDDELTLKEKHSISKVPGDLDYNDVKIIPEDGITRDRNVSDVQRIRRSKKNRQTANSNNTSNDMHLNKSFDSQITSNSNEAFFQEQFEPDSEHKSADINVFRFNDEDTSRKIPNHLQNKDSGERTRSSSVYRSKSVRKSKSKSNKNSKNGVEVKYNDSGNYNDNDCITTQSNESNGLNYNGGVNGSDKNIQVISNSDPNFLNNNTNVNDSVNQTNLSNFFESSIENKTVNNNMKISKNIIDHSSTEKSVDGEQRNMINNLVNTDQYIKSSDLNNGDVDIEGISEIVDDGKRETGKKADKDDQEIIRMNDDKELNSDNKKYSTKSDKSSLKMKNPSDSIHAFDNSDINEVTEEIISKNESIFNERNDPVEEKYMNNKDIDSSFNQYSEYYYYQYYNEGDGNYSDSGKKEKKDSTESRHVGSANKLALQGNISIDITEHSAPEHMMSTFSDRKYRSQNGRIDSTSMVKSKGRTPTKSLQTKGIQKIRGATRKRAVSVNSFHLGDISGISVKSPLIRARNSLSVRQSKKINTDQSRPIPRRNAKKTTVARSMLANRNANDFSFIDGNSLHAATFCEGMVATGPRSHVSTNTAPENYSHGEISQLIPSIRNKDDGGSDVKPNLNNSMYENGENSASISGIEYCRGGETFNTSAELKTQTRSIMLSHSDTALRKSSSAQKSVSFDGDITSLIINKAPSNESLYMSNNSNKTELQYDDESMLHLSKNGDLNENKSITPVYSRPSWRNSFVFELNIGSYQFIPDSSSTLSDRYMDHNHDSCLMNTSFSLAANTTISANENAVNGVSALFSNDGSNISNLNTSNVESMLSTTITGERDVHSLVFPFQPAEYTKEKDLEFLNKIMSNSSFERKSYVKTPKKARKKRPLFLSDPLFLPSLPGSKFCNIFETEDYVKNYIREVCEYEHMSGTSITINDEPYFKIRENEDMSKDEHMAGTYSADMEKNPYTNVEKSIETRKYNTFIGISSIDVMRDPTFRIEEMKKACKYEHLTGSSFVLIDKDPTFRIEEMKKACKYEHLTGSSSVLIDKDPTFRIEEMKKTCQYEHLTGSSTVLIDKDPTFRIEEMKKACKYEHLTGSSSVLIDKDPTFRIEEMKKACKYEHLTGSSTILIGNDIKEAAKEHEPNNSNFVVEIYLSEITIPSSFHEYNQEKIRKKCKLYGVSEMPSNANSSFIIQEDFDFAFRKVNERLSLISSGMSKQNSRDLNGGYNWFFINQTMEKCTLCTQDSEMISPFTVSIKDYDCTFFAKSKIRDKCTICNHQSPMISSNIITTKGDEHTAASGASEDNDIDLCIKKIKDKCKICTANTDLYLDSSVSIFNENFYKEKVRSMCNINSANNSSLLHDNMVTLEDRDFAIRKAKNNFKICTKSLEGNNFTFRDKKFSENRLKKNCRIFNSENDFHIANNQVTLKDYRFFINKVKKVCNLVSAEVLDSISLFDKEWYKRLLKKKCTLVSSNKAKSMKDTGFSYSDNWYFINRTKKKCSICTSSGSDGTKYGAYGIINENAITYKDNSFARTKTKRTCRLFSSNKSSNCYSMSMKDAEIYIDNRSYALEELKNKCRLWSSISGISTDKTNNTVSLPYDPNYFKLKIRKVCKVENSNNATHNGLSDNRDFETSIFDSMFYINKVKKTCILCTPISEGSEITIPGKNRQKIIMEQCSIIHMCTYYVDLTSSREDYDWNYIPFAKRNEKYIKDKYFKENETKDENNIEEKHTSTKPTTKGRKLLKKKVSMPVKTTKTEDITYPRKTFNTSSIEQDKTTVRCKPITNVNESVNSRWALHRFRRPLMLTEDIVINQQTKLKTAKELIEIRADDRFWQSWNAVEQEKN